MEKVVETLDLNKRFGNQRAVVDLNMHVPRGATYGLLGPNGAGKTTVLKLVLGLLRPTRGEVMLFGEPWRRSHLGKVGALIETPALYENLTGPENLAVHTRLLDLPRSLADAALKRVGLADVGDKVVSAYSLGMRQRLGIAIALLGDPELLILDEPTNGLDPVGIRETRDFIRSLHQEGLTIIVSSHLLSEVAQVATHVGVLVGGVKRYEGTLDGLLASDRGHLAIVTTMPAVARDLLLPRFPGTTLEGERVLVPVAEQEAAAAISTLYQAGVPVLRMAYEHADLETQFLRLVEPSGVPAVAPDLVEVA